MYFSTIASTTTLTTPDPTPDSTTTDDGPVWVRTRSIDQGLQDQLNDEFTIQCYQLGKIDARMVSVLKRVIKN
jgi:hypothetical protein